MRTTQRGMTLAEVLMSVAMTGVLLFAMVAATSSSLQTTKNNEDKAFATQKALAMLEEMKALVQVNSGATINVLDTYDDGSAFFNVLTIAGNKLTDPPDSARSGNLAMGTSWLYSRQISVQPLTDPSNPNVVIGSQDCRLVRVRVYKNDAAGNHRLVAEVAGVLRTLATIYVPSQVYDVYCVAVENVPGWWVNMGSLIPFVQNAISDLQNRHPGLVFRQHWITKLAYGRDPQYMPFVNATNANTIAPATDPPTPYPISYAYFYPGQLPTAYTPEAGGSATTPPAQYYYPTPNIRATFLSELGVKNPLDASANPYPYTLADQFNHAMRYYDELSLYNQRVAAVDANGVPKYTDEEKSLRLLLDDMYMNPGNYTNAIVINLHGELLPFPPLRNYSDAAKKPDYYRGDSGTTPETKNGVRVVTHPEQLTYAASDDVELRVYSYLTNPDNAIFRYPSGTKSCLDGVACAPFKQFLPEPITVIIKGIDWTPLQISNNFITAVSGGVDLDNSGAPDVYSSGVAQTSDLVAPIHRMYYTRSLSAAGDTVLKLYNSPLVSPCVDVASPPTGVTCSGGGLTSQRRLYGMEYIPAPLEDFTSASGVAPFQTANNLDAPDDREKNTARWIIHIPASPLNTAASGSNGNKAFTVETRIGDYDPDSNTFNPTYNQAPNISRTYFWRGSTAWLYGDPSTTPVTNPALPMSERFQFQGDPRHCPYADLKMTHDPNGTAYTANTKLGMGYNRYFDNFQDSGGNKTMAEYTSRPPAGGNYTVITSGAGQNNLCYVSIDGGATMTVTLTGAAAPGTARTAAQIRDDFNANGTFSPKATASNPSGNLLTFRSDNAGAPSSVQFFTGGTGNCSALLGLDTRVHYAMWPGWFYQIGSTQYGIKNDQTSGSGPNPNWATTNGAIEFDVPRAFQIWRSAMMTTNSLFTTMSGWPYFYMDIGNAIGKDADQGYSDNIPVPRRPFDGTDTAQYFEQTISAGKNFGDTGGTSPCTNTSRCGGKYIFESDAGTVTNSWWGIPWLGELYPDKMYNLSPGVDWKDFGNLPTPVPGTTTATAANTFRRIRRDATGWGPNPANSSSHTIGTTFSESVRRTHEQGMPMFFWQGGTTGVEANGGGSTGAIATGGTYINTNYNYTLPASIPANRPFQTSTSLPAIDGFGQAPYGPTNSVSSLATFYNSNLSGQLASALLGVRLGATTSAMYVVENGLSPSGAAGTDFIAHFSFLTLIQGYFEAGLFNGGAAPAAAQLPRIAITTPNNNIDLTDATTINITWSKQWLRWDGVKYASGYATNYSSNAAMSYLVLFSKDNGQTWRYAQDGVAGTPVKLGTRLPSGDSHYITTQSYTMSTPVADFPTGPVIIRVEAYRNSYPLHYSFHQYMAFINRSQ